jgi:hypothetical protein
VKPLEGCIEKEEETGKKERAAKGRWKRQRKYGKYSSEEKTEE